MIKIAALIVILSSCTIKGTANTQGKLLSSDYRLFKNTPAWPLAKAVENEDTSSIRKIITGHKVSVDYPDPVYGGTLLDIAVFNRKYSSVEVLLELGADPNKQNAYNKTSALMTASRLGGGGYIHPYADSRYLKILLKYGGDPNAVQDGDRMEKRTRNYFTPLSLACISGIFEYVQILVNAGADVNFTAKDGSTPLCAGIISGNPDIVLYLLKKGANFNQIMYTTIKGEKKSVLDGINSMWHFDENSSEFKKEVEIKDFLKAHYIK